MALLITTEATLFASIFSTYVYLWIRSPRWPPAGIEPPKPLYPLLLTAALVATSLPIQFALASARRLAVRSAVGALILALVVQAGYLTGQFLLFARDLHRFPPDRSAYASIYFTMLGIHHTHVVAGMLLELWFVIRLTRGVTRYRLVGLHGTTIYWHFVNTVAVLVVALQLSPR
jgi:heme/copper-type cytochrome/quinol oxidase subunit 3